ncbi:MAG: EAL domain-containing protein [Lachnospiraceae bacterium]|nr:EAL domain-containing protein [Lachnospiraceae bacterium]
MEKVMLVVDDAAINRSVLRRIFQEEYEIVEAADGEEALALIEQYYAGNLIVTLDLRMPRMDGFEVLERVRQNPKYESVPIIVNTEYGDETTELRVLRAGADDFISKPYLPEIVRRRVYNVHARYELKQLKMERELRKTSQQLQSLMASVPGGIGIFELKGTKLGCRYFNEGLAALLGYTKQEYADVITETALAAVYPEDLPKLMQAIEVTIQKHQKEASNSCEFRMIRKDGSLIWIYLSAAVTEMEEDGIVFSAVFSDITANVVAQEKIEAHNRELKYLVEHDALTGLYNRETFCKKTEEYLRNHPNQEYVMIRMDVERFKVINELFGAETGDLVLRNIASVLKKEIGKRGMYGRLEADHFAVCIARSEEYYEQLLRIQEEQFAALNLNYRINMYMGVYIITDRTLSLEQMCERANMALGSVKGKSLQKYAVYRDSMRTSLVKEQFMINEMHQALERGQFTFYLQPIFDAVTELPVSAEALVRWEHPVKGMLSPADFIPLFERNGFITKLDPYIWREVCRYLSDALARGEHVVPVSVNVSRINLFQSNLCEEILGIVDGCGLDHSLIKFEITESAYMDDSDHLLKVIEKLQSYGFKVLMDDFGSGYSSLNMLKETSVDILKIDMRFLKSFKMDTRGVCVLDGIIRMAKDLNMKVVAEGVETEEQLNFLKNTGCDWIQGYYFSKPVSLEDYRKLLGELDQKLAATWIELPQQVTDEDQQRAYPCFAQEAVHDEIVRQRQYFDVVRLVDPIRTRVCNICQDTCETHACYSVWGKNVRCSNCISLRALEHHGRFSKLEYSKEGVFFVISQYMQVAGRDYVMEMVTHLEDEYVGHLFDKDLLLVKLNDLNRQLIVDELTGVYNRRHIDEHLSNYIFNAKNSGGDLGIAMVDIDNLKMINDTFGHMAGDSVIRHTAKLLQENIARSKSDFVARYGGDEFLLVCRNVPAAVFRRRLEELLACVKEAKVEGIGSLALSVSIGAVTLSEFPDYEQKELIETADRRLYEAKRAGRGVVSMG